MSGTSPKEKRPRTAAQLAALARGRQVLAVNRAARMEEKREGQGQEHPQPRPRSLPFPVPRPAPAPASPPEPIPTVPAPRPAAIWLRAGAAVLMLAGCVAWWAADGLM